MINPAREFTLRSARRPSEARKSKLGTFPRDSAFSFISLQRKSEKQLPAEVPIPRTFLLHFPPIQDAEPKLALKFMDLATDAGKGNEIYIEENGTLNKINCTKL